MKFPCIALLVSVLLPLPLMADDLPVITIRPPAGQMKYDQTVVTTTPGSQVKLVFGNLDEMPHNFVLCHPLPDKSDKWMEVARLAWQVGAAGPDKAWIPDSPRIMAHTGLMPAHGKVELVLKMPDQPGRLGNEEVKADGDEFCGMPLKPQDGEAVIYRNFISGAGPRGIAVGYPNGVNLCFDADQMAPALFWQGAFMDAKRHWTGRGSGPQPPLGYNIFQPAPAGPSLALLEQADTPWPAAQDRAAMLRFRGYRLDEKRFPSFKYEMGSVTVTETYQPAGSAATNDLRVARLLYFHAPQPISGLQVRAAAGALQPESPGLWAGKGYRISVEQGEGLLRGGQELLVPVVFTGETATVAVTYHWNP